MTKGGSSVFFMSLSLLFLARNRFQDKHASVGCTTKCELLFCSNFIEHYTQRQAFKKAIKMQTDLAAQEWVLIWEKRNFFLGRTSFLIFRAELFNMIAFFMHSLIHFTKYEKKITQWLKMNSDFASISSSPAFIRINCVIQDKFYS